jgi:hypothetical protein
VADAEDRAELGRRRRANAPNPYLPHNLIRGIFGQEPTNP